MMLMCVRICTHATVATSPPTTSHSSRASSVSLFFSLSSLYPFSFFFILIGKNSDVDVRKDLYARNRRYLASNHVTFINDKGNEVCLSLIIFFILVFASFLTVLCLKQQTRYLIYVCTYTFVDFYLLLE